LHGNLCENEKAKGNMKLQRSKKGSRRKAGYYFSGEFEVVAGGNGQEKDKLAGTPNKRIEGRTRTHLKDIDGRQKCELNSPDTNQPNETYSLIPFARNFRRKRGWE